MEKYKQRLTEKIQIILDIGTAYTKIGFAGENSPIKILKTPKEIFQELKQFQKESKEKYSQIHIQTTLKNEIQLQNVLDQFLNQIFYNEIMCRQQNKTIYLCQNFNIPIKFYDIICTLLFNKYDIPKVYFLLNNSLPLYITGQISGLVVDSGYYDTQIMPIYEGYPIINAFECLRSGGWKTNIQIKNILTKVNNPDALLEFDQLEEIKFKYCKLLYKNQEKQYYIDESNKNVCQNSLTNANISGLRSSQKIKISFKAATKALSKSLFGKIEKEQPNIAYSILKCLQKLNPLVSIKVCQNIVLAGGMSQVKNYFQRIRQEVLYLIQNEKCFENIRFLEKYIAIYQNLYPGNCLNWVGASIVSQLIPNEKYCITVEDFKKNGSFIVDKYQNWMGLQIIQDKDKENEQDDII